MRLHGRSHVYTLSPLQLKTTVGQNLHTFGSGSQVADPGHRACYLDGVNQNHVRATPTSRKLVTRVVAFSLRKTIPTRGFYVLSRFCFSLWTGLMMTRQSNGCSTRLIPSEILPPGRSEFRRKSWVFPVPEDAGIVCLGEVYASSLRTPNINSCRTGGKYFKEEISWNLGVITFAVVRRLSAWRCRIAGTQKIPINLAGRLWQKKTVITRQGTAEKQERSICKMRLMTRHRSKSPPKQDPKKVCLTSDF